MRRADRLFQIVGVLRRRRQVTAQQLAEQLEVSARTVYRDVADLVASGVPIAGEAGVGYRLDPSYRLPPLLFTPDEVEALVLGMRLVETWADDDLRRSARAVLDKIDAPVRITSLYYAAEKDEEAALRKRRRPKAPALRGQCWLTRRPLPAADPAYRMWTPPRGIGQGSRRCI